MQGEIDAREDSFRATAEAGQLLVTRRHYASDEVKEKLSQLDSEKTSLLSMWEERRILYEQCMDLQLFYRDTEQADTWMAKQEVIYFIDCITYLFYLICFTKNRHLVPSTIFILYHESRTSMYISISFFLK